jgi:hypothetical protein
VPIRYDPYIQQVQTGGDSESERTIDARVEIDQVVLAALILDVL